ncbi:hypothetical protein LJR042_002597 [Microbacterium maritypicum]|uniref:hypothetical protein n=1 Tax=Microbacterium TaxID=33882 RepID=UPI001421579D|nr:hypothetical protein [Microbacterium sp. Be9]NIG66408.1 hypothetical protein [Microbacterium sp. Be9]
MKKLFHVILSAPVLAARLFAFLHSHIRTQQSKEVSAHSSVQYSLNVAEFTSVVSAIPVSEVISNDAQRIERSRSGYLLITRDTLKEVGVGQLVGEVTRESTQCMTKNVVEAFAGTASEVLLHEGSSSRGRYPTDLRDDRLPPLRMLPKPLLIGIASLIAVQPLQCLQKGEKLRPGVLGRRIHHLRVSLEERMVIRAQRLPRTKHPQQRGARIAELEAAIAPSSNVSV